MQSPLCPCASRGPYDEGVSVGVASPLDVGIVMGVSVAVGEALGVAPGAGAGAGAKKRPLTTALGEPGALVICSAMWPRTLQTSHAPAPKLVTLRASSTA